MWWVNTNDVHMLHLKHFALNILILETNMPAHITGRFVADWQRGFDVAMPTFRARYINLSLKFIFADITGMCSLVSWLFKLLYSLFMIAFCDGILKSLYLNIWKKFFLCYYNSSINLNNGIVINCWNVWTERNTALPGSNDPIMNNHLACVATLPFTDLFLMLSDQWHPNLG